MNKFKLLPVQVLAVFVIASACGPKGEHSDYSEDGSKPEDNRFTPVSLTKAGALDEPMMFQVTPTGVAYIIERKGVLKKYDPATDLVSVIATFPVFTGNEQGLIGLALDPAFEENGWIYLQYAPADESIFRLVRFEMRDDSLVQSSEKVLLEIPVDREGTSHTGGGMTWDAKGNLYLTVGNNTGNGLLAQTDERPGYEHKDDQRGASNTNDLRGKILRIHPEPDGTYSIPEGNLFPPGTPKTRPEIYTMGHRNVWRVYVDSNTGWIYWGEIGPDQDQDTETGPRGYDEHNQAKGPGFFGWPYFIADNISIPKYDYAANKVLDALDPNHPINTSPNNTGLQELPPAQPALIYYPYAPSEKFPLVGSSSRCAIGGPVYHRSDFDGPERAFPHYYEGVWFIADYSRFWIMAVTLDENGNYKSMERFVPQYHPVQPLDIKFGPEGDLYVLEYGSNSVRSAMESRLVRIEYQEGNRKPIARASASKPGGAVPFTTQLSAEGTIDYDNDELDFTWTISSSQSQMAKLEGAHPEVTLEQPGEYDVVLTVTDPSGESDQYSFSLIAGNEPPAVSLRFSGNQTFFFPDDTLRYQITVSDREDGDIESGDIPRDSVSRGMSFVAGPFDPRKFEQMIVGQKLSGRNQIARYLIGQSDCNTCHTVDVNAFGPSFVEISKRYALRRNATDTLVRSIINGSAGKWGMDNNMPAHPTLSPHDARRMSEYILELSKDEPLPNLEAVHRLSVPEKNSGGEYILHASYSDQGNDGVPPLTTVVVHSLRSPRLNPVVADEIEGGAIRDQLDEYVFLTTKPQSWIVFKQVDLTEVRKVLFRPNWHLYDIYPGGRIEIRIGSPQGPLIGETNVEREQFNTRYRGAFGGLTDPTPEQKIRTKKYEALNLQEFFAPGADKNDFTIPSVAEIKSTLGYQDIYFRFVNDTADADASLFPLAEIQLMNE